MNNKYWKICTCNTRGINNQDKQDDIIEWHTNQQRTITSITETRTNTITNRYLKNHYKEVTIYATTDPNDINGSGTAIIINKELNAHVQEIRDLPGRAIILILKFKKKINIAITSIYNKANKDRIISRQIIDHLKKLDHIEHQIIMGDLNENQTKKGPITKYLANKDLINTAKLQDKDTHITWQSGNKTSTIDYIWMSHSLASKVTQFAIQNPEEWFNTDHQALEATIDIKDLEYNQHKPRKKYRKIFNIRNTDSKNWKKWKESLLWALKNNTKNNSHNRDLNKQWSQIRNAVVKADKKHFGLKKIPKEQTAHSRRECEEYKAKKILSKIIREQNHLTTAGLINRLGKTHSLEANQLLQASTTDKIPLAKTIRKAIRKARLVEAAIHRTRAIEQAIQERANAFNNNKRRTINATMERSQNNIEIDHIITNNEISTEATEVKALVDATMNQWTRKRITTIPEQETWHTQYQPIPANYFQDLMDPTTDEEFDEAVKSLPINKSPGPARIPNEMWKKAPALLRNELKALIDNCIIQHNIPTEWTQAIVILIPKKETWGGNLQNTRPITLIETGRKLLTRILTNRISKTCTKYNILKGDNFSVLKDTSTAIPIQIINFAIEHATTNKKTLWLVTQDMKKAYDSVGTSQLTAAMKRINIHSGYIDLINNIQKGRHNTVQTFFGQTDGYQVQDGLDQGEVNAPIHWRIFYDPLLTAIKRRSKRLGYPIKTKWENHPSTNKDQTIISHISSCAFVDDTIWCSSSRTKMQQILDLASEFYRINDIEINTDKSAIIVINPKTKPKPVTIQGRPVIPLRDGESTRYLGIYLSTEGINKPTIKKVEEELIYITNKIKTKAITDKQAHYLIHNVLFPIIEYRTQASYLTQEKCEEWDRHIRGAFKRKARLPSNIPTNALQHPHLYNIKKINTLQAESKITNITIKLNTTGTPKQLLIQQILECQLAEWLPDNPLSSPRTTLAKRNPQLIAGISHLLNNLGLRIDIPDYPL